MKRRSTDKSVASQKGNMTWNILTLIKEILGEVYEQFYASTFQNLDEIENFVVNVNEEVEQKIE